jgi:ATP-dependent HslUV protease ATP-binding subunit HslU
MGENIGARRLHGVFEELLEDISFNAGGDEMPEVELNITADYVRAHVAAAKKADLNKYIL